MVKKIVFIAVAILAATIGMATIGTHVMAAEIAVDCPACHTTQQSSPSSFQNAETINIQQTTEPSPSTTAGHNTIHEDNPIK